MRYYFSDSLTFIRLLTAVSEVIIELPRRMSYDAVFCDSYKYICQTLDFIQNFGFRKKAEASIFIILSVY